MPLEPGSRLAHYEILDLIGRGGMGEVYRAHDTRLGRDVALKVLPTELSHDEARLERFENEARTLARLNHPNIVTIHSVEEADGIRFLTMELMEGRTLDELLDDSGLPLDQFLDLMIPIATALASAHEKGVTHRDLKPSNVMVDDTDNVKVLDFGLAKLQEQAGDVDGSAETQTVARPLTEDGQVVGTVAYMSPEQARSDAVDHRSDIFCLGVMMYEMATGRHPFRGSSMAETLSAILRDDPPAVTDDHPELPNHLGRIVRRCLEKDPSKRLQSARDLANDLDGLRQEASPVSVSAPVAADRSTAPADGAKMWRMVAAAALLVLVTVGAIAVWRNLRPEEVAAAPAADPDNVIVVFPFDNLGAPEDAYFASGMADEISSRLGRVDGLRLISRTSATQYDRTGKTMPQIAEDLGVDYVLEGTVRWSGGDAGGSRIRITPSLIDVSRDEQLWSASYDETLEEIFAVQSRVAEQVIHELNLTLGDSAQRALNARPTDNLEAYRAYLQGIESQTHGYYSPEHRLGTIAFFEEAVQLDPDFALAWAALSQEHSYFFHLRYDTTESRCKSALDSAQKALDIDPDLPEAHLAKGFYHYHCHRDYENALAEFSIVEDSLPNNTDLIMAIGAVQRRMGEFAASARTIERAVSARPLDHAILWDLGVTYAAMGDWDRALARLDDSIAIAPDEPEAYAIKVLVLWVSTGDLVAARAVVNAMPVGGSHFEAWIRYLQLVYEGAYSAALQEISAFPLPAIEHTTHHWPKGLLVGDAHRLMGQDDEAAKAYDEALIKVQESLELRSEDARIHAALGQVLARMGRSDEAVAAGRHAVELYPTSLDAFHGPYLELELARIYGEIGEIDDALEVTVGLLRGPQKLVISVPLIRLDPRSASVLDDPRWLELETEFGLSPSPLVPPNS